MVTIIAIIAVCVAGVAFLAWVSHGVGRDEQHKSD